MDNIGIFKKEKVYSGIDQMNLFEYNTSECQGGINEFDLNIEKILENWEVYHAIREIVSNALDEKVLTQSDDIQIMKQGDVWHIIDYGRGLNYHHLTQNENKEKLQNDKLIGRFGVGLKDSLATLHRHNIQVRITSKYGIITLSECAKTGFTDIITLHAKIDRTVQPNIIGTDFALYGCSDNDIEIAKSFFLMFTNAKSLEITQYGEVIEKIGCIAYIYINGVKVAEESNFLFSYNITSLNKNLKKALNRERTNVGRTAYTDRIKSILLSCDSEIIIDRLINDLKHYDSGMIHDELLWNDIALHAAQQIKKSNDDVVFVTANTAVMHPNLIDEVYGNGFDPFIVPESLMTKLDSFNDETGFDEVPILTVNQFVSDMEQKKKYIFVDMNDLSENEKKIYAKQIDILNLIGGTPKIVKEVKISESIYESEFFSETVGIWDISEQIIVIKRCQLSSLEKFAGTLIHECIHASSSYHDVSRDFEKELTNTIGLIASKIISNNKGILSWLIGK